MAMSHESIMVLIFSKTLNFHPILNNIQENHAWNFKAPILLKLMGATGMDLELSIIPFKPEEVRAVINKSYSIID